MFAALRNWWRSRRQRRVNPRDVESGIAQDEPSLGPQIQVSRPQYDNPPPLKPWWRNITPTSGEDRMERLRVPPRLDTQTERDLYYGSSTQVSSIAPQSESTTTATEGTTATLTVEIPPASAKDEGTSQVAGKQDVDGQEASSKNIDQETDGHIQEATSSQSLHSQGVDSQDQETSSQETCSQQEGGHGPGSQQSIDQGTSSQDTDSGTWYNR